MKIRQEVFDTYWKFAAERQEIFFKRLQNVPSPWTQDPILQSYKFCNTYRASDRVSQFLIQHVIYQGDQREEEVIFRILLFKLFNKIETWKYLQTKLGEVRFSTFRFDVYARLLEEALGKGDKIYSNAYMSCANKAFGFDRKHMNHLALLEKLLVTDKLAAKIMKARSLGDVFQLLRPYPLIGDFMAYQLATDLNYSDLIDFDENDFTVVGPGSERGIKKCFVDTGGKSFISIIRWMQEHQDEQFERLGIQFKNLCGRPLQLIDCQGLFCETDKYSRAAFPELKSNRKRIKAPFKRTKETIVYFYPPKWGINDKIQALQKASLGDIGKKGELLPTKSHLLEVNSPDIRSSY